MTFQIIAFILLFVTLLFLCILYHLYYFIYDIQLKIHIIICLMKAQVYYSFFTNLITLGLRLNPWLRYYLQRLSIR